MSEGSNFLEILAVVITLLSGVALFIFGAAIYRGTAVLARGRAYRWELKESLEKVEQPLEVIEVARGLPMRALTRDPELLESLLTQLARFQQQPDGSAEVRAAIQKPRSSKPGK